MMKSPAEATQDSALEEDPGEPHSQGSSQHERPTTPSKKSGALTLLDLSEELILEIGKRLDAPSAARASIAS